MGKKVLVVVDMQNDFVTGCLGSEAAQAIVASMVEYVKNFEGEVVFTYDTHTENYMNTQEGRKLPVPHCIEGTEGWQLVPELEVLREEKQAKTFRKPTFGSVELAQYLKALNDVETLESITLIGVCTDICVVSNSMTIKAFLPETEVQVVAGLTAATSDKTQQDTLSVMKCCQITVVE